MGKKSGKLDRFGRFLGHCWSGVVNLAERSQGGKAIAVYFVFGALAALPWVISGITDLQPYKKNFYFLAAKPIWTPFFILGMLLWKSFEQWDELNENQKPNLELSECQPQDSHNGKGRVFLFGITNRSSNDIEGCSVRLINIKTKSRNIPCNDALTFQPSEIEPSTERTLHPDHLNIIDVIFLFLGTLETVRPGTKVNGVVHYWNKSETFRSYFIEHGPYILSIAIIGKNFKQYDRELRFTYAGDSGMLEVMPPSSTR